MGDLMEYAYWVWEKGGKCVFFIFKKKIMGCKWMKKLNTNHGRLFAHL
jgi:hypothetical protein